MNDLQTFIYNNSQVRTVEKNGEPWWVLKDVCDILGLGSPHKVADRLDEDEKGRNLIPTPSGKQEMTIISESGLYNVILRSDKPEAKPFRKWVTAEVLPAIRKTGSYNAKADKPNKALEIKEMNAKVRLSNQLLKPSKVDTLSTEYKNILAAKAAEVLTGTQLIPLPQSEQKMYTAIFMFTRVGARERARTFMLSSTAVRVSTVMILSGCGSWDSLNRDGCNPITAESCARHYVSTSQRSSRERLSLNALGTALLICSAPILSPTIIVYQKSACVKYRTRRAMTR